MHWPAIAVLTTVALVVTLCIAAWVWVVFAIRKEGWRRTVGLLAVQMALIQFFFLLLHGSVVGGLLAAPFAPLSLPYAIYLYLPFGKFALKVAIWVAPWVAAAVALCLARPGLREWSLAIPLVFGLAVSIPVGEWQSKRAMCEAASNLGFSGFRRNSFSWSLSNRNQDWQWEIHGFAVVGGQRLGWSYREMDWFSIPGDTGGEVLAAVFECPSDI